MLCDDGTTKLKCNIGHERSTQIPSQPPSDFVTHAGRWVGAGVGRHKAEGIQAQGRQTAGGDREKERVAKRGSATLSVSLFHSILSMTWTGDQRRASSHHDSTAGFPTRRAAFPESGRFWSSLVESKSGQWAAGSWSGRVELLEWLLPFEKMRGRTFDGSVDQRWQGGPCAKIPCMLGQAN